MCHAEHSRDDVAGGTVSVHPFFRTRVDANDSNCPKAALPPARELDDACVSPTSAAIDTDLGGENVKS